MKTDKEFTDQFQMSWCNSRLFVPLFIEHELPKLLEQVRADERERIAESSLDLSGLSEEDQDSIRAVVAERVRQVEVEGWTAENDDQHNRGEMASAAACYTLWSSGLKGIMLLWPWVREWWKPSPYPRRNLEKAGALILAEMARLLRIKQKPAEQKPTAKDYLKGHNESGIVPGDIVNITRNPESREMGWQYDCFANLQDSVAGKRGKVWLDEGEKGFSVQPSGWNFRINLPHFVLEKVEPEQWRPWEPKKFAGVWLSKKDEEEFHPVTAIGISRLHPILWRSAHHSPKWLAENTIELHTGKPPRYEGGEA